MHTEILNVAVLPETGILNSSLSECLAGFPRLKVWKALSHEDLLNKRAETEPDLVIVDLDARTTLPEWLPDLSQSLLHATVMVCSYNQERDFLIRVMQTGVREFLQLPLRQPDLEEALERVTAAAQKRRVATKAAGRMMVVTGLKGGAGATSVAVNLAISLAETYPDRVALVDLGRPFSDVDKFLDQEQHSSLLDLAQNVNHLDSTFVSKALRHYQGKLAILHGCDSFVEWGQIDTAVLDKVWNILRTMFDWIVVDLSHWLDEMYLKTLEEADQVLLLAELSIPSLKNLKNLWEILRKQGIPLDKVKVVINRYNKGQTNGLTLESAVNFQQQPIFFTLPSDFSALNESINHGVPLSEVAPRSKLYRSLRELSERLVSSWVAPKVTNPTQAKIGRRFLFF